MRAEPGDLFAGLGHDRRGEALLLRPGVTLFPRLADRATLLPLVDEIARIAPFRTMTTPGGGRMSVAMTSCGAVGWTADRTGYRYAPQDPLTGRSWPAMPESFRALAEAAAARAGHPGFAPDSCLVNRYEPGARLGLHQDRDEADHGHPVVSVSLGLPAVFLMKPGTQRSGRSQRVTLRDGDVLVFGGPARLMFHGVDDLPPGIDAGLGAYRLNLTFRRAR